jgi:hypothetical protein
MPEFHLRAADSDRTAVAVALGEHMSAGRLTLAEYDERTTRAYAAKTFGDLAELTADLPPLGAGHPGLTHPTPTAHSAPAGGPARAPACGPLMRGGRRDHSWRSWVTTSLIVVSIWLAASLSSGHFTNFWPIWVIVPWGAVLLAGRLAGGSGHTDRRRRLRA